MSKETTGSYYFADLATLRMWRADEQATWSMPTLMGQPGHSGTSPWAADWDAYIAEAEQAGATCFVVVPCAADYDDDQEGAALAAAGHERCVVGNVDGDDIFGFVTSEARVRFAEWCEHHVEAD